MSVWLTDLADILRNAGLPVIEEEYTRGPYAGRSWKQVGYGGQGLRAFQYVLLHHDASPQGDSPGALEWCKYMEWAPAAASWVCTGCHGKHESGTWHVYAGGLSSHAGSGGPWNPNTGDPYVPKDAMNSVSWGIETDHTFGESWSGDKKQAQLNSIRVGIAAVMKAYKLPATRLLFHKTWTNGDVDGQGRFVTYGRKNDIDGLDLAYERGLIGALMAGSSPDPNGERLARLRERLAELRRQRQEAKESGGSTSGLGARIRRVKDRIKELISK